MKGFPINDPDDCPIKPSGINNTRRFFETFGSSEAEDQAHWLVDYFQHRGEWGGFSKMDLVATSGFNSRVEQGFIVEVCNLLWVVTTGFVALCYASSPARPI